MSDDTIKRLRESIAEHPLSPIHGYAADIAALLDENERLRKFVGNVLDSAREEFTDVSCRDIVDFAKQFGLLEPVTMASACGYDCSCAEWADFPIKCLRPTALGCAAIDAARREK